MGTLTSNGVTEGMELLVPGDPEFALPDPGRTWAITNQYLLVQGLSRCAHGLYGMTSCPTNCRQFVADLDHANLWVPAMNLDGETGTPFILSHSYSTETSPELKAYALSHGLRVEVTEAPAKDQELKPWEDAWYGLDTIAVRLSIPRGWPLWPIERLSILLQATQPPKWPES